MPYRWTHSLWLSVSFTLYRMKALIIHVSLILTGESSWIPGTTCLEAVNLLHALLRQSHKGCFMKKSHPSRGVQLEVASFIMVNHGLSSSKQRTDYQLQLAVTEKKYLQISIFCGDRAGHTMQCCGHLLVHAAFLCNCALFMWVVSIDIFYPCGLCFHTTWVRMDCTDHLRFWINRTRREKKAGIKTTYILNRCSNQILKWKVILFYVLMAFCWYKGIGTHERVKRGICDWSLDLFWNTSISNKWYHSIPFS